MWFSKAQKSENAVVLNQTDKIKLLIYAGDFANGGAKGKFNKILQEIDFAHMDVSLVASGVKDEKAAERVADLPKEVRVLYWKRSYPATDEEYVCHDQFIKSESEEVPEMLKDFYSRELRRVIGMSHFDYAVVLTKMKRFFPIMSGSLDVKKIYTTENWEEILKL